MIATDKSPGWGTCDTFRNVMQRYFGKIEKFEDLSELLHFAREVQTEQGVIRQSYHFSPIFEEPNSMRTIVYSHGYNREWLKRYDESEFRLSDPIPGRTLAHGAMLTWAEAMEAGENTPANLRYFAELRKEGLVHGFGIPLFGPRGRNSYASYDFGRPPSEVKDSVLGTIRSVAQAAHQRICVLIDNTRAAPELSDREKEVLGWIARGKSMGVIATILELSPETVKTYSKRTYEKLGVSDRVGATVKALKLGLIKI